MDNPVKIKAENLTSLAANYGISPKTMKKWLIVAKLYKPRSQGYMYTPKEVMAIYEHLGNP